MANSAKSLGLVAACGALAALLAACSNGTAGGSCATNLDCADGSICVGGECISTETPGCENDDACAAGEFCDPTEKICKTVEVVGCSTDETCPPHQRCNTLTSVCIDGRRTCTDDAQCSAIGKRCDLTLNQCVDCLNALDCEETEACLAGDCIDPTANACTTSADCNPPSTVCLSMQCVPGCNEVGSPVTCQLGFQCDVTTGECVPGSMNCSMDSECNPPATICESNSCLPGCTQVGGLQCTGGNVCNTTTGRCESTGTCTTDAECGAPVGICENSMCTPGCGQPGGMQCGAGTVCDTTSGRCVTVQGPCTVDTDCTPPQTICVSNQCVGGCDETGGIQCTGNTVCNTTTGRCDPGGPVCTGDADCAPPATICNLVTGACDPGCGTTGCVAPEVCNTATGQCYDPGNPPGTAVLNDTCTADSDCASRTCFDFGTGIGTRCVASCGTSGDCPAAFTCYDYFGARMCISAQHFTNATFSTPNGGACATGGECRSNYCPGAATCVDTCAEDDDCGGGQCKWEELATNIYIESCDGPLGAGVNGATCQDSNECRGGVCYGQGGTCGDLCGSSSDCLANNACGFINFSDCTASILGNCLNWEINFVKACVATTIGAKAIGDACADSSECRDAVCDTTVGQCTGFCSRDVDCPSTHHCGVLTWGTLNTGQDVFGNLCIRN